MSPRDPDPIDAEIRAVFADIDVGSHPSAKELAAYARDELPEAEERRLQHHLGLCRECTAAVLALDFSDLEVPPGQLSDAEVADEVEAIMARASDSPAPPAGSLPALAQPSFRSPSRALFAVAAMLAVACLSLALFTLKIRQQVGELEDALHFARQASVRPTVGDLPPQTGVPIVDLFPSSVARGETAARPISLGSEATMAVLILTPPSGPTLDAYDLQLLDQTGAELWRGPAQLAPAGVFVLLLPRHFAEAGADRVVLYGLEDGSAKPLEIYPLRFEL